MEIYIPTPTPMYTERDGRVTSRERDVREGSDHEEREGREGGEANRGERDSWGTKEIRGRERERHTAW